MNTEPQVITLGFVNAFLIPAGDGYVLIDTGMDPQWEPLESQLLKAGCLPDKLKLVVLTHGDLDHTGNCAKLPGSRSSMTLVTQRVAQILGAGQPTECRFPSIQSWLCHKSSERFYKTLPEERPCCDQVISCWLPLSLATPSSASSSTTSQGEWWELT